MNPAETIARAAMDALGFLAFALFLAYLLVMGFRCEDRAALDSQTLGPAEAQ